MDLLIKAGKKKLNEGFILAERGGFVFPSGSTRAWKWLEREPALVRWGEVNDIWAASVCNWIRGRGHRRVRGRRSGGALEIWSRQAVWARYCSSKPPEKSLEFPHFFFLSNNTLIPTNLHLVRSPRSSLHQFTPFQSFCSSVLLPTNLLFCSGCSLILVKK